MNELALYDKAFELWGYEAQIKMVIEETLEFALEVHRLFRHRTDNEALTKEIADIEIMIAQMKFIANISEEKVKIEKQKKLWRLEQLIKKEMVKNDISNG